MTERCVHCGLEFSGHETVMLDPEALGRANTEKGPMHFSCYWKLLDKAHRLAMAPKLTGRK